MVFKKIPLDALQVFRWDYYKKTAAKMHKNVMLRQFDSTLPHDKCNKNFSLSVHIYRKP